MNRDDDGVAVADETVAAMRRRWSTVRPGRLRRAALWAVAIVLLGGGSAIADLVGLPANGAQVNNDPANGIDPNQSAGQSDVVGGSLTGEARIPWATFEQKSGSSQQIFVRAFKGGQWVTQGQALNLDPNAKPKHPR